MIPSGACAFSVAYSVCHALVLCPSAASVQQAAPGERLVCLAMKCQSGVVKTLKPFVIGVPVWNR